MTLPQRILLYLTSGLVAWMMFGEHWPWVKLWWRMYGR